MTTSASITDTQVALENSQPSSGTSTPLPPPADATSRTQGDLDNASVPLSDRSVSALERLAGLKNVMPEISDYPARKLAAVLVLLHADEKGELAVTLTTRAKTLRSHPGQTALPGGRVDETDDTVLATALREAHEEISLPLPTANPSPTSPQYRLLGTLPPFVSRNLLIVVPVIYFLTTPYTSLLPTLSPSPAEVSDIFHWPLRDILQLNPPSPGVVYTYQDVSWILEAPYRWHSIDHPDMPSAITGLTFDILCKVVMLAYPSEAPGYQVSAKGQLGWEELIKFVIEGGKWTKEIAPIGVP